MQSKLIKIINYTSISLVFLISLILFLSIQYPQILKNKFLIKNINITGDDKSDKQDIKNLVIAQNKDLYLIKLQSLKEVIEAQEWVKKVNIKKIFPSTIEINITENDPFAVYVSDQDTYLIDVDGSFITKVNQDTYDHNLLIVRGNQSHLILEI
jgi:Cell division septal protein